ncbi:MAG: hypothetical protein ACJ74W_16290 [Pyrinomonadaceae bacterium]
MNHNKTSSLRANLATGARTLPRRLLCLALVVLACAPAILAQAVDDYHKVEVYGGYSLARSGSNVSSLSFTSPSTGSGSFTNLCSAATGEMLGQNSQKFFCQRRNFNGFDASATYNVSRYFGLKGDVTGHFKSEQFVDDFGGITQTINVRERLYNFLGGVQVKDNRTAGRRIKPFAHALVGVARYTNRQGQTVSAFPQFNFVAEDRVTSFAMKLGGGLDVRAGRRVDLRVIEFDYNPVFTGDRNFKPISGPFTFHATGKTAHNYTIGFGIVIH